MERFEEDGERTQFWQDLTGVVETPCATHELIDDALRTWLDLVSTGRDQYLEDEIDLARCSQALLTSPIFQANREYVRTQIIYSLLQEDDSRALHAIANLLLLDGRSDDKVFESMIDAGCFSRLVDLIKSRHDDDRRLHRLLLELMYEMSRIERVRLADLLHVDDAFIIYLFKTIEGQADEMDDPYHYPLIRVLLVLNEQYMVAATAAAVDPMSPTTPVTNRVIKVLSLNGPLYRTFGENIILLLNRETETSLQLLILKLLYLLFTTKATYEYFYTNDLRVLLDVIIRNLLDLPNESNSLRHTYLRVLYPLLAHTQLNQPPHYKRGEILRVLAILSGSGNVHFAPADETTLRLVDRVSNVEWLSVPTPPQSLSSPTSSPSSPTGTVGTTGTISSTNTGTGASGTTAPTSMSSSTTLPSKAPLLGCDEGYRQTDQQVINKFLGISLSQAHSESCDSVLDVAAVKEKPGVKTPSRKAAAEAEGNNHHSHHSNHHHHHHNNNNNNNNKKNKHHRPAHYHNRHYVSDSSLTSSSDESESESDDDDDDGWNDDPKIDLSQSVPSIVGPPDLSGVMMAKENSHKELAASVSAPATAAASPSKTATPPIERHLKPKQRVLPAVPKHRHGVLMKPPAPAAASSSSASEQASGSGVDDTTVPAVPVTTAAVNVGLAGIKKLPPKAPPPRRGGRVKSTK